MTGTLDRTTRAIERAYGVGRVSQRTRDDVLALVEVAKAAQALESWHPTAEGWNDPAFHPQHREACDALRAALARLEDNQYGVRPNRRETYDTEVIQGRRRGEHGCHECDAAGYCTGGCDREGCR